MSVMICEGSEECSGGQLFQKWNKIYPHSYSQHITLRANISCEKIHVKKFMRKIRMILRDIIADVSHENIRMKYSFEKIHVKKFMRKIRMILRDIIAGVSHENIRMKYSCEFFI